MLFHPNFIFGVCEIITASCFIHLPVAVCRCGSDAVVVVGKQALVHAQLSSWFVTPIFQNRGCKIPGLPPIDLIFLRSEILQLFSNKTSTWVRRSYYTSVMMLPSTPPRPTCPPAHQPAHPPLHYHVFGCFVPIFNVILFSSASRRLVFHPHLFSLVAMVCYDVFILFYFILLYFSVRVYVVIVYWVYNILQLFAWHSILVVESRPHPGSAFDP